MNESLKNRVLGTVHESRDRLTRPMLEKAILTGCGAGIDRAEVRAVIRHLVEAGELSYTYEHGSSFVEPALNRPFRISPHVTIAPIRTRYRPEPSEIVIRLQPGASFGTGSHPSTQAAVRCLEYALLGGRLPMENPDRDVMLDIGSGSGILMIAALLMGVRRAVGIDREACAVFETRDNLRWNRLSDRAEVSDRDLAAVEDRFFLVTANLRYPTLVRLADRMADLVVDKGLVVLSGIQVDEFRTLRDAYGGQGFEVLETVVEKDWLGVVLGRA